MVRLSSVKPLHQTKRRCGLYSDVRCAPCAGCSSGSSSSKPTSSRDIYINPQSLCSGYGDSASAGTQQCLTCRTDAACGSSHFALWKCMASGRASYDTTVCVERSQYIDPIGFQCAAGTYLRDFSPTEAPSEPGLPTFAPAALVYMSPDNSRVAEILPDAPGVLKIHATQSAYTPMVFGDANVPLVLHVAPENASAYSVRVGGVEAGRFLVNHSGTVRRPIVPGRDRMMSSGAWSVDSSTFFLVWMDGTVSRASNLKAGGGAANFTYAWSPPPPPSAAAEEADPSPPPPPLWAPTLPPTASAAAEGYAERAYFAHGKQCFAVPLHSAAQWLQPWRQVQLICLFNYLNSTTPLSDPAFFGSYLTRIRGDGRREAASWPLLAIPHASSSMLYDAQFNAAYVTTYKVASFSGPKHVLKFRLTPTYDVDLSVGLAPSGWIMPPSFSGGGTASYPAGMAMDHSAIEPLSGILLFYTPTVAPGGSSEDPLNLLYYIPPPTEAGQERASARQPVLMQSAEQSPYYAEASGTLLPIATAYHAEEAPHMLFTLYTGLWVRYAWLGASSSAYIQLAR